ncbi:DUF3369 domain-containing protein [Paenibacillus sp. IB182493]|uniref:DUF3369 domain-containing protein n=2 Tax=Paenibacillus arenilitoris TaxID=2772299 RepID=A0A927CNS2_9BACL|nr:DUF3369 domain-containing protein [Paenibacillus arenilitoris]
MFRTDEGLQSPEEQDELVFLDESDDPARDPLREGWNILIVDDHDEIHKVTSLVLGGFEFDGKRLRLLHAYSGAEAIALLQAEPDIALVLLDVVMEKDDAGLQVIEFIRRKLCNDTVRIVLRTGQPGQAPEHEVVLKYDINDYKEKTELTSQKLFTTIISSLRSYRDLRIIQSNKKGLEDVVRSSSSIMNVYSVHELARDALAQIGSILGAGGGSGGLVLQKDAGGWSKLAGSGAFAEAALEELPPGVMAEAESAAAMRERAFYSEGFTFYFRNSAGGEKVVCFKCGKALTEWDRYLIEVYCANIQAAFENIDLNREIESTQKEIIYTLGEIAETRSKETGFHVKRVAEYTKLLALKHGLPKEEAELISLASPMHDIGKVGISDAILNKPGKLTGEEYEIMKTHAQSGYDMLKHSGRPIMKTASIIALQHHEKYDGTGYPQGLKGEEIHIYGRLTALADVFDALASDRVYKKAWPLPDIIGLLKEQRGKHFDPVLTDLFLAHLDEFLVIREKYADEKVF